MKTIRTDTQWQVESDSGELIGVIVKINRGFQTKKIVDGEIVSRAVLKSLKEAESFVA